MREVIHNFGREGHLNGIASLPDHQRYNIGIIVSNSGVVHKVGPFGLFRELASHLCAQGFTVFRFDLSGLGDSDNLKSGQTHAERTLEDMQSALDLLESRYQFTKFVAIGLCTGAENSFRLAIADERVVGNIWLDGYGYDNLKGKLIRFYRRSKRLPVLLREKLIDKKPALKKPAGLIENDEDYTWTLPPRQVLGERLNTLFQRGVRFLCIYSGGVSGHHAYAEQFADNFKGQAFLQGMQIEYFPQADHTYKIRKDKAQLFDTVAAWLKSRFHSV